MDAYKYRKRQNRMVFTCWLIISLVLTVTYFIEYILGNMDIYYVTQYFLFIWIPLIVSYGVSLILGRGDLRIKYLIELCYCIFYIYTQYNSTSRATFCYIIPLLFALIVYEDTFVMDSTFLMTIITNVIYMFRDWEAGNITTRNDIAFYEIIFIVMLMSAIFSHKATNILKYSNSKLMELNNEIAKDELTNVHNRYFLKKYLEENFHTPEFVGLSLAIIDVDSFKSINDNYGHKFGDLVLRKIAGILKESIADYDETYVVRIGGDEFIIVSTLISKEEMFKSCEEACKSASNTKLQYGDEIVNFTISIGVANSQDDNCDSYAKLYEIADSMLYTVKNNGKSSVAST